MSPDLGERAVESLRTELDIREAKARAAAEMQADNVLPRGWFEGKAAEMLGGMVGPLSPKPGFDYERVKRLGRELLEAIGEDPDRPDLRETPRRWADWWREFVEFDPGKTDTAFEAATAANGLVVISGIRVWSLCEHHLLPFWCDLTIGYVPFDSRILGLSKFGRIAEKHAHRLQVQERLAEGVMAEVKSVARAIDVAVLARGEHLCMTMRGVRKPHAMTTLVGTGSLDVRGGLREDFIRLAGSMPR